MLKGCGVPFFFIFFFLSFLLWAMRRERKGDYGNIFFLFTYLSHCSLIVPYWRSSWNVALLVKLSSLSLQLPLLVSWLLSTSGI